MHSGPNASHIPQGPEEPSPQQPAADEPGGEDLLLAQLMSLYSQHFLRRLAWSLGLMYWGLVIQVLAALLSGGLLFAWVALDDPPWLKRPLQTAFSVILLGGVVVLWGQWACYNLRSLQSEVKLPGQRWLQASLRLHMAAYLIGLARAGVPQLAQSVGALRPWFVLGSFVLLLCFLRKLAGVLLRHDLERHSAWTLGLGGLGVGLIGLAVLARWFYLTQVGRLPGGLGILLLALWIGGVLAALATVPMFMELLRRMRSAVIDFCGHLEALDQQREESLREEDEEERLSDEEEASMKEDPRAG